MQVSILSTTTSTSRRLATLPAHPLVEVEQLGASSIVLEVPVGIGGTRKSVSLNIGAGSSVQQQHRHRRRRLTDAAVIEYKVSFTTDDSDSTMDSVK